MVLETYLIALVLTSALVHSIWNALVKTSGDEALMLALMTIITGIMGFVGILTTPPPEQGSWLFIATSVIVHVAYLGLLIKSYQSGELSQVYPISRGVAPLIVALVSTAVIGEHPTVIGALGIILISLGVMSLTITGGAAHTDGKRPILFSIMTGFTIAAYTVIDGLGIRESGSPLGYISWLFFLEAPAVLFLIALTRSPHELRIFIPKNIGRGMLAGLMSIGSYGLVLYAMSLGSIAPIAALRETSSIFIVFIGKFMLGESLGLRRILASTLVVSGVVALNWST